MVKTHVATVANRWDLGMHSKLINTTWCITVNVSQNDLVQIRVDFLQHSVGDVHNSTTSRKPRKVGLSKNARPLSPSVSAL